jgi:serine protease inhibitor
MKRTNIKECHFFRFVLAMSFSLFEGAVQSGTQVDQQQLASANTEFGFRLLKELTREQPHANIFISPYSVSSVLQMVSTGARGQTQKELRQVLGTKGLTPEGINAAYEGLSQSIRSAQSNAVLNIANVLWYRTGAQLNTDFVAVNETFYQATLGALDFSLPQSAKVMNDWAAKNTQGRIPTIIQPPIPSETAIVLANAIYFKGAWLNPFDTKLIRQRAFHLVGGREEQLPMMEQTRSFLYQQGPAFQAVQLSYAGQRLQMQIVLPSANSNLEALVEQMDPNAWKKDVLDGFHENRGTLVLPRFKIHWGGDLKNPLTVLGLKQALSPNADFSAMSPSRLFLSEIKHQSFVEVNEEGTEAAAVTTGIMALASFRNQPQPFQMIVDRPFLFAISDQLTKSILFMGVVFDPGSSGL